MSVSPAPKPWADDSPTCETHTLFGNTGSLGHQPSVWSAANDRPRWGESARPSARPLRLWHPPSAQPHTPPWSSVPILQMGEPGPTKAEHWLVTAGIPDPERSLRTTKLEPETAPRHEEENAHGGRPSLGSKHLTIKRQVSFSQDSSEPLLSQRPCASPRGRNGIRHFPSSSYHKSLS